MPRSGAVKAVNYLRMGVKRGLLPEMQVLALVVCVVPLGWGVSQDWEIVLHTMHGQSLAP
jgi:hypothetical protein